MEKYLIFLLFIKKVVFLQFLFVDDFRVKSEEERQFIIAFAKFLLQKS